MHMSYAPRMEERMKLELKPGEGDGLPTGEEGEGREGKEGAVRYGAARRPVSTP